MKMHISVCSTLPFKNLANNDTMAILNCYCLLSLGTKSLLIIRTTRLDDILGPYYR
jgi:hypothetical protein